MVDVKFELYIEGNLVGDITFSQTDSDFPWCVGTITYTEVGMNYRDILTEFNTAFNSEEEDDNRTEILWNKLVSMNILIKSLRTGEYNTPSIVIVDGDTISWR